MPDRELAGDIHLALERLKRPWYRTRSLRIFRDITGLGNEPDGWGTILARMNASEFFILLACPESAQSQAVSREVGHWLATRPADRILLAHTGGTIKYDEAAEDFDWNVTDALNETLFKGQIDKEPFFSDFGAFRSLLDRERYRAVKAVAVKIGSKLLDIPLDRMIALDRRVVRRNRAAGILAITALVVLTVTSGVFAIRAGHEAREASIQAAVARQQARVATAGQLAVQSELLDGFSAGTADVLAAAAWQLDRDPLSADAVADALQRPRQLVLRAHTAAVTGVAFADGGKEVVTVGYDGDGYLWDAANGAMVRGPMKGYQAAPVNALAVSPDGKTIATGLGNHVYLWGTDGAKAGSSATIGEFADCHGEVTAEAFSPDGRYLAVACPHPDHTYAISLYGLVPSAKNRELTGATAPVNAMAFSPGGRTLAAVSGDDTRLWTVATGAPGPVLLGDTATVTALAFSPGGRTVATASADGTARLWSAATGHQEAILRAGPGKVTAVAFSPDGSEVVTGSVGGTAWLWNAARGSLIATLAGSTGAVRAVAFDPKEPIVVTAGGDGTARVWDARTGTPIAVLRGDIGPVNAIAISPDGRTLATASDDTTSRLWDLTFAVPYTVSVRRIERCQLTGLQPGRKDGSRCRARRQGPAVEHLRGRDGHAQRWDRADGRGGIRCQRQRRGNKRAGTADMEAGFPRVADSGRIRGCQ